jgi:hypothetical protein
MNDLPSLNFPAFSFSIKSEEEQKFIFDRIRKKFVALTPEEWVRQHLVWYLIEEKKYPEGLINVEFGFKVNQIPVRVDVAVFSKKLKPIVLCECKAPGIKLSNSTLSQAGLYNLVQKSPNILITNGMMHYFFHFNGDGWLSLKNIPDYSELDY